MEAVVAHALDWDRMDTDSSQLETPPAWFHIDNQATRTTEANPSHHYEKSQAYGSTSRTVRGKGVGGLETTRLGSNTVSICYCFVLREHIFSHSIRPSRPHRSRLTLTNLRANWILP